MAASRVVQLSTRIAENTAKLNEWLATHALPIPSFDEDEPSHSLIPKDEPEVGAARDAIIDDTAEFEAPSVRASGIFDELCSEFLTLFIHQES